MFFLTSINLSNFRTDKVEKMNKMFYGCEKLASLDLSSFDTNSVTNLQEMFTYCYSLTSLNLSNFYTPQLKTINGMFSKCTSLKFLDISNFNTEKITEMKSLFYYCQNLISLDLKNFNTSEETKMTSMFSFCESLTSLDLSNFNTEKVTDMKSLFFTCRKLENINLNNFKTNSVTTLENMFYECNSLTSLNLTSFDTSNVLNMKFMFSGCIKLVEIDLSNFITSSVTTIEEMFSFCSKIEYINFEKYEELNELVITNILKYAPDNIVICINDISKASKLMELFETIPYYTIYCGEDWKSHQKKFVSETNSYVESLYNSSSNIINSDISIISDIVNQISIINLSDQLETQNLESNEEIYQEIIKDFINQYNISKSEVKIVKGKDNFFYQITTSENDKNSLDEIFTNRNITNNFSTIDLGHCDELLKNHYQIDENASLIIIKFEKMTNNSLERSLQYELYDPFNKTKLNLSICDNTTINIYVPLILSQDLQDLYNELKEMGYDLFDEISEFYQDICTPYKSSYGTDVLLSDRYNYYFNNNETKCQSNCKFSEYLIESNHLKCECDISNSEIDIEDIDKFKPKILYQSFYDTLKFSNYKVLKCYKLAFSTKCFSKNKGSIITIVFFVLYLALLIIHIVDGMNQFKKDIARNLLKNPMKSNNDLIIHKSKEIIKDQLDNNSCSSYDSKKDGKTNENIIIKNDINYPPKKHSAHSKRFSSKKSVTKSTRSSHVKKRKLTDKLLLITSKNNSPVNELSNSEKFKENNESNEENQKKNLDNFELNNLEYNMAKELDKRDFLETYWSILRREHLFFSRFW